MKDQKDQDDGAEAEGSVRQLWADGRESAAVSAALKLYGAEVYGLLLGLCRGRDEADDAFSLFAEGLWQSLSTFEWKCSLRTWAYVIARRSALDLRRKARRPHVGLSQVGEVSAMVARIRTETAPFRRTDVKDRLAELRSTLPEDDQMLLILRLDRGLAWEDLARVFAGEDAEADALKRESARLRKRFQTVKDRLVELGRKEGLLNR
jgi:RNA polymerase sigma-70 factor (ECF subfamily)